MLTSDVQIQASQIRNRIKVTLILILMNLNPLTYPIFPKKTNPMYRFSPEADLLKAYYFKSYIPPGKDMDKTYKNA